MTKIIGHRGAAGVALENSPASIKTAIALPIDAIELDIRATRDNKLIVLHDRHTGRLADKKLWVADSALADLQKLRLQNGEHILTLDEAFQLIGNKMPVILDLKSGSIGKELVPIIKKHPKVNVTLSSRNYPQLHALHKLLPAVPFVARSYIYSTDIVHIAHKLGANGISVNKWVMSPLTYHLAKRAELEVQIYTVNHPWLVHLYAKLYPDCAIYTDHPERFMHLNGKSRERRI